MYLYPEAKTYDEMKEAFDKTIDYYINHDPQERFNDKIAGQVRTEAKTDPKHIIAYKIVRINVMQTGLTKSRQRKTNLNKQVG